MGPVIALTSLGVVNNLYTQIGLILIIALSAKNGILIVEMAREGRLVHGLPILEAAVEASRLRFRPILMTSFRSDWASSHWCWRPEPETMGVYP